MKTCRSSISSVFVPNWRTFILQLCLHILLFAGDIRGGGSDNHMARSAVWGERTDALRAYAGFHYDRQTTSQYDYYTGISSRKRQLNSVKNDNRCCRIMSTRVARPLPVCQLCDCVTERVYTNAWVITLPTIRVITRVSTILANKDDQYWWWWW